MTNIFSSSFPAPLSNSQMGSLFLASLFYSFIFSIGVHWGSFLSCSLLLCPSIWASVCHFFVLELPSLALSFLHSYPLSSSHARTSLVFFPASCYLFHPFLILSSLSLRTSSVTSSLLNAEYHVANLNRTIRCQPPKSRATFKPTGVTCT